MNKQDLINAVSENIDKSKVEVKEVIDATLSAILTGVDEDGEVALASFGKFAIHNSDARLGRNPRTGEEVEIPASRRMVFKASHKLKEYFN